MAQIEVTLHIAAGLPGTSFGSKLNYVTISQTVTLGDDMTWDPSMAIPIPGKDIDGFVYCWLSFESDSDHVRIELADWTIEPMRILETDQDPDAIGGLSI